MSSNIIFGLCLAFVASAHVFMGNPAPLQWSIEIDQLVMPMNGDPNHLGPAWGQQPFPCKGHNHITSRVPPQTTWYTGTNVTFQLFDSTNETGVSMHSPGAAHSGGSCQISFSYNNGETWIVIQSWEGNCPRVQKGTEGQLTNVYDTNQDYSFYVPTSLASADRVLVAWTWINASGNREFYMSCSSVRIQGLHTSCRRLPFNSPMLIANLRANPAVLESQDWIWSRCNIPHGVWIRYPEKYRGINPPIVAQSPLDNSPVKFLEFDDPGGFCGSDNNELVQALGLPELRS